MQWLWFLLTPVFWLTSLLLNPWVAASLLGTLTTAGLAFRRWRPSTPSQSSRPKTSGVTVVTDQQEVVKTILQVFPIHPSHGWALSNVSNSVRVFSRVWDLHSAHSTHPTTHTLAWNVYASSIVIECPPDVALLRATSHSDLPLWVEGLSLTGLQLIRMSPEKDGDLIRLTLTKDEPLPSKRVWLVGVVMLLLEMIVSTIGGLFGRETSATEQPSMETLSRSWYSKPGLHYLHTVPQEPSSLPYHWSALLFTRAARDSRNVCMATLVMLPRQSRQSEVKALITSQLSSLRGHVIMKNLRLYPSTHHTQRTSRTSHTSHTSHLPPSMEVQAPLTRTSSTTPPVQSSPAQNEGNTRYYRRNTEPAILSSTSRLDSNRSAQSLVREVPSSTIATPPPPIDSRDAAYLQMAKEKSDKLISSALGTEEDGWTLIGNKNRIRAMKLAPKPGEGSVNCVRGTGIVNVPPKFIMHFLKDPTYNSRLDGMLKEVRVVQKISPAVQLVHMLYKAVWPTAPRDFAVLNISGIRDSQTLVSAAVSVTDDRISDEKGHVRGHLDAGGYVIRAVPGNPNISEVVYVAQVDLKGSLPAMVTNKIADLQPQCVNTLRGFVETLYTELGQSPQAVTEYEEKFPIAVIVEEEGASTPSQLPVTNEAHQNVTDGLVEVRDQGETEYTDRLLENGHFISPPVQQEESILSEIRPVDLTGPVATRTEDVQVMDELQFESPQLDAGMTPHPQLIHSTDQMNTDFATPTNRDIEFLETYTPEEISSDVENYAELGEGRNDGGRRREDGVGSVDSGEREDGVERVGGVEGRDNVFMYSPSPRLELKLPRYRSGSENASSEDSVSRQSFMTQSLTMETIGYPRQETGSVDFKTMANHTAARVLEEAFHVTGIDLNDSMTFEDQTGGWTFSGFEKDVVMLIKKSTDTPFNSFIGKGVIDLPPQEVYDSIRNPQLRFIYDNMLKELHIVKQIDEGLYILHMHHETTQCFVKQSRDFCLLVSERSEPNKKLLIGTSIEVPECPPKPDIHRGKVVYSGWVVEPYRARGKLQTEVTYLLQVDMGGIPASIVNFISKRQPLAVAYLRDYLISTSLDLSLREDVTLTPQ
ncbi:uncharacterized protein LOC135342527 isoform X2 [Halichondria panicea]|uniref:uncharacterized protein LOC135342527 isoform X2 n=1 Tax=Halichondria panicea TaxID=6063 RepID=UPI00312BB2B8